MTLAPKVIAAGDLRVGLTAEYEREIKESDVLGFAANSGDFNPLHMDSDFAQHSCADTNNKSERYACWTSGARPIQSLISRSPIVCGASIGSSLTSWYSAASVRPSSKL